MEVPDFFYYILYLLGIILLVRSLRWFLEPYFVYSRRHKNKEIELYVRGQKTNSQGIPFLLKQETTSSKSGDTTILQQEICDLTLVVPCYNEEKRLPQMLDEHITYIRQMQASKRLPGRIEIILVDDGSKDKTL
jgi:cellulose synthase/poly-beta-1,6-N-acetylglucosamine synthase-like glycosyltransferase